VTRFLAEHFVQSPQWTWYILFYFFFAGLAAGAYVLGTLLRFSGDPRDEPAARIAFLVCFPATVICPVLSRQIWASAGGSSGT